MASRVSGTRADHKPEVLVLSISATEEWSATHPGAGIGVLELTGVENEHSCAALDARKRAVEAGLRTRYAGFGRQDLLALPVMAAYSKYYRRFEKTYHVQLQLESIVLKGKDLPDVSPSVDAGFMAELETLVLTAAHDAAKLRGPILMDVSREGEHIVQMNGVSKALRPGDMIMRDAEGVCCSIIYGQDDRSPVSRRSSHVLYVAYAPAGVPMPQVELQLRSIVKNVRLCSPALAVEQLRLLSSADR
jgi:DNA/RNA-binding domain of Phe-tRNA-synthetase-like protein